MSEFVALPSEPTADDADHGDRPRSRRNLLKVAGVATVAGGAMLLGQGRAEAASGGNMIIGSNNDSQGNFTGLNSATQLGAFSVGTDGMTGTVSAIEAIGSGSGCDVKLNGTGRLGMAATVTGDAEPGFSPLLNDLVRSTTGALWAGTGTLFSTPANPWKRINAVRVDNPNGNGTAFKPFRFVDTRSVGGALSTNTSRTHNIAGAAQLPSNAIAVFGNITAVQPSYSGWITLYPTGTTTPTNTDPSSINFVAGDIVANSFIIGLGTGANAGKLDVRAMTGGAAGAVNYIIDIFGYMQ